MFCTECGAIIKSGAKFCGKCGTAINLEEQEKKNDLNEKNQQNKSAPSSAGLNEQEKYDAGLAASRGVKKKSPIPKAYDPGLGRSRRNNQQPSFENNNANKTQKKSSQNILISRFFARIVDTSLVTTLYFIYYVIDFEARFYRSAGQEVSIGLVLNSLKFGTRGIIDFHLSRIFFIIIVGTFFLHFLVEPLLISIFGTTPGKAIYGITVRDSDNSKLNIVTSYKRSFQVYWQGIFLGVFPLSIIANAFNFIDFQSKSITRWDKSYKTNVVSRISSTRRYLTHLLLSLSMLFIFSIP